MTEHDAVIERELAVVDAALAAGVATAPGERDRELEELALALAAETAEPEPVFAAGLRERVGAGFPRRRFALPVLPGLPKVRRPQMIALAGAASALAAVAVALSLTGEEPEPMVEPLAQTEAPGREAAADSAIAPAPLPPDGGGSPLPPNGGGFVPRESERRIERSAALTLAAPEDRIEQVAGDIVAVTDRLGGFVLRSSVSAGEDGDSGGDFELRIPAAQLQQALRDLSKLGDVRARTQAGQDVTREFVSVRDRLETARAERRSLLARLESAETDVEAESIRRRLDLVAAEVNGLRGQRRDLRLRTDYATVAVTLERDDDEGGSSGGGAEGGGLGGALDDALGSLSASVEILVRTLGVAIPLGLLGTALWLGARVARRRRREAVLGG